MIKINVIFVHGIELLTFTENLGKSVQVRNLPHPFLRGQPLKITYVTSTYSTLSFFSLFPYFLLAATY